MTTKTIEIDTPIIQEKKIKYNDIVKIKLKHILDSSNINHKIQIRTKGYNKII